MTRHVLVLCLTACVAACASREPATTGFTDQAITPTQQFAVTVVHHPDQILLAAHATGLSPAQAAAVAALADRWRDAGVGPVVIQTPSGGGGDVYRSATAVQGALLSEGLPQDQIQLVSYQAAAGSSNPATIMVGFTRAEARGPQCGLDWQDYTKTGANKPNSNFGCAVTANFAALIANPSELENPHRTDASDANRRETILGKYRKGDLTATVKDQQANGAVSTALQ